MKTFWLLLVMLIAFVSCKQGRHHLTSQKDSTLLAQKRTKSSIDKYISTYGKYSIVLVKIPRKDKLVAIENGHWPDEVEYTYKVYENASSKVIFISQTPFSESGDWDIVYKHYFDDDGNTCAFCKQESLFDDGIKGGIIRELLVNYYDKNFKILKQINKLTDKDYLPIKKSERDFNFRDDKYKVYKDVRECLEGYNIILPKELPL